MNKAWNERLVLAGRVLIAVFFLQSGVGKLLSFQATAGFVASAGLPLAPLAAAGAAVLEIVCGLALLFGFRTAKAALALTLFTCVATVLFHNFWSAPPGMQMVQKLMFMKNLAIVGALLCIAGAHAKADAPIAFNKAS